MIDGLKEYLKKIGPLEASYEIKELEKIGSEIEPCDLALRIEELCQPSNYLKSLKN
jgi:hypothetical protein